MALLAGGVAAFGGRVLCTAKSLANFAKDHSSQMQQQMVRGSYAQQKHELGKVERCSSRWSEGPVHKDMSQAHFRGACTQTPLSSSSVMEVGQVLG